MEKFPCVAIIIENTNKEILLLLRDDKPWIAYPNCWTLVGGHVEDGETAEKAALRELQEEVGLNLSLNLWKRYDYEYAPEVVIDQHIFVGVVASDYPSMILGEGQDMRFFKPSDLKELQIGFEFDKILSEYMEIHLK